MAIDKIFDNASVDGIADNLFKSVSNSVSEVKAMQQRKAAENVQLVIQALKKIESDIQDKYDGVTTVIEKRVSSIKDGRDGRDGVDGKAGKDGRPGRDGATGPRGIDGLNGRNGVDGEDGVSVVDAHIDFDGSLIIGLSSGRAINVGEVVAPDLAEKIKVITNGGGTSQQVLDTLVSLQNQINAITTGITYQGTWNASTNTPTLTSSAGTTNGFYIVSVAGSTTLNGISNWGVGDWAIFNGTIWQRVEGGSSGNFVDLSVSGTTTLSGLTASTALALDASKNVVSVTNTGTGSNVLATSPILVTPALGTPSSGVVTNLTGTASININGTVGATTPAAGTFTSLTDSGNLTFTGTGNRITGDFTNATFASRVMFQTSTANSNTAVEAIPSGTGVNSTWTAYNNSDPTNASFISIGARASTDGRVESSIRGTGTYLPMTFYTGGSERMRLDTSGNVGIGTSSPGYRLDVQGATASTQLKSTTGTNYVAHFLNNTGGFTYLGVESSAGGSLFTGTAAYEAVFGTVSAYPVGFATGGAERMRIDSSGNVGIGTGSPGYKLDVQGGTGSFAGSSGVGAIRVAGAGGTWFWIDNPTTTTMRFSSGTTAGTGAVTLDSNGNFLVTSAAGLGYGTGSGGTVTQATSKSTSVTLNKPTGQITTNAAALAGNTAVGFVVNNSLVTGNDTVLVTVSASGNYTATLQYVTAGSFRIVLTNATGGSLSDAVLINFSIIKGATA